MKRKDFRHLERLRVRWPEVDMQQIVFNGHYLAYVDTAVAGYWRALALPYQATFAQLDGDLFVRKATLDYLDAAQYDDQLEIGVRHESTGNSSLRFAAGVFRGEHLLVSAELVYVFADPQRRIPASVPTALRDVLSAFESGQSMLDVQVGSWAELGAPAQAIRHSVFVQEQGIPAELEWDEADADCVHALALNRMGLP
ncbi:YbgC/FadM family acyl-CoA thioesterase, partial [Ideonella sp.]|uniref:YbgC/FadM family acyl-CoA thioesterase n=1 Tax=Ideonella sp. TaxID=1929293 RepID=UPI003BB627AF